jgi:formylglycine-generating enzyme required for sulfatase activity
VEDRAVSRVLLLLLAALPALYSADTTAHPPRRALVIGNAAYKSLPPVPASAANADLIAQALTNVGFQPVVERDLTQADMIAAVTRFLSTIQPGDFVFVYFSGYGLQDNEVNYLLPVSFDAKDGLPLSQKTFSVRNLLARLEDRKAGTRMVILDASRPNPDLAEGLFSLTPFNKTLIASSAMPNQTTADPPGRVPNLFAKALAKAIQEPGSSPQRVLASAQAEVSKASDYKQSPFFVPAPIDAFYFVDPLPDKVVVVEKPVQPGDVRENTTDGLNYVWVPAGAFQMGCVPADKDCQPDEKPRHDVKISKGFWMTATEVTSLAYEKFAAKSGHALPQKSKTNPKLIGSDLPVNGVAWQDAADYCSWAGGRLPTEAEWEYAARGRVEDKRYPWGDKFDPKAANSFKSDHKRWLELAPVRFFGAGNGYNLFDMVGNASEWVADYYAASSYQTQGPAVDPQGPASGVERVIRGGSFNDGEKYLRLSARDHRNPAKADNTTGFRCLAGALR